MRTSLLLKNCDWVLTQNPSRDILRNVSVYVEDGKIAEIGESVSHDADQVIEGRGKLVMPGLINTHTHLSMTLFRGYADDMPLQQWLEEKIWPLEKRLNGDLCYKGALLGCLEMIRTGTTTFMDMYFFMEDVARAVLEAGIRGIMSYAMIDIFDREVAAKREATAERLLNYVQALQNPRIGFAVGPHSPYTCSRETLLKSRELAEKSCAPIHIHIAETRREQVEFEKKFGRREVEYLDDIGFLCPSVVSVHSVWLTKREVDMLAKRGVKVSHCPISNMKLADGGVAPLPEMLESGVVVSLGTDGAASNNCLDMFDTMKFCALEQKAQRWDPTLLSAQEVLDLATLEGARALGMAERIGSLEERKEADIVVIDLKSPNLTPIHGKETIVSDVVYSAKGMNVDTTIVEGQVLMSGKRVHTLNELRVLEQAQEAAEDLMDTT